MVEPFLLEGGSKNAEGSLKYVNEEGWMHEGSRVLLVDYFFGGWCDLTFVPLERQMCQTKDDEGFNDKLL